MAEFIVSGQLTCEVSLTVEADSEETALAEANQTAGSGIALAGDSIQVPRGVSFGSYIPVEWSHAEEEGTE